MTPRRWIAVGSLWMALAVVLGAFGAHALHDRLVESDHLETWRSAVLYQAVHGIALILYGLFQKSWPIGPFAAWCFLIGSLLFSGSIYLLSLGIASSTFGLLTPVGGLGMTLGWLALSWRAFQKGTGPSM
ncbi:MAG: DUF423 domain-containing protein [Planctomycetota bacterium]|nr:DUF423 domain-containing protein [Planctomycetota bacterium]